MYSFVLTTYNDAERAIKCFESLKKTIPVDDVYRIVVVDAGSTPDQIKLLEENIGSVIGPHKNLSEALNAGIYLSLGYFPDNIQSFIESGSSAVDHVFWIHTDCEFPEYDWAGKLCWIYDQLYPLFGRLGPATSNIDGSNPKVSVLRGGNQCPWVFGREAIHAMLSAYGYVYNPEYINIGGYEDWDCGQRLLKLGYGFGICSLVDVWHEGMGTRKLRDTTYDQQYNGGLYNKIWNTWEQPGFELDLTEIGNDLKVKFEEKYKDRWYVS